MIIFLLVSECGEGKSISSKRSPWICQQGRFTPFVSEGYLGIRRYPGPFKREVKNVVFFIAESRPCVGLIIGGRNVHLRELREVFVK